jgi:hypothetical protein
MRFLGALIGTARPCQPRDRGAVDLEGSGNGALAFTLSQPLQRFLALVVSQLRLRQNLTPVRRARLRPSVMRDRMISRSNSAVCRAPHTADYAELNIMRSGGVRAPFLRPFCGRRAPHNRGRGDRGACGTAALRRGWD